MADLDKDYEMEYRYLGNSGLRVSALSLGGWMTYGTEWGGNQVTHDCMRLAYEKYGVNFFDTAEVYADGKSEVVMGEVIKAAGWERSSYVLSTKIFWGGSGVNQRGLSRKHIVEGTRASLARLQHEYADIILAHRPDPMTPMEEIVRAFTWLIDQGLCFYWGTSEWSATQLMEAHKVARERDLIPPTAEQPQYNMLVREKVENEFVPLYSPAYGLGLTTWSPLLSGVLTGKYNDGIPAGSRLSRNAPIVSLLKSKIEGDEGASNLERVRKLAPIAEELGVSQAQLALAWTVSNKNVSTVITGATNTDQVAENMRSLRVVEKLTDDVKAKINEILGNEPVPAQQFR